MPATIDAKVLRAVSKITEKEDVAPDRAASGVGIRPDPDATDRTVVEACNGRAYIRVSVPEAVDESVFLERTRAKNFDPEEKVVFSGNKIIAPFELALPQTVRERPERPTQTVISYPDTETLRPDASSRVAFAISPRQIANAMSAIAALGVSVVEILLPRHRGGPIGFRGATRDGRYTAEGAIQPADLFGATAADVDDAKAEPALPRALPHDPASVPRRFEASCPTGAAWEFIDAEGVVHYACDDHRAEVKVSLRRVRTTARHAPLTEEMRRACSYVYRETGTAA